MDSKIVVRVSPELKAELEAEGPSLSEAVRHRLLREREPEREAPEAVAVMIEMLMREWGLSPAQAGSLVARAKATRAGSSPRAAFAAKLAAELSG